MVEADTHKGMTQAREDLLRELVDRLHLPVKNMALLDRAFTHTSYANEKKSQHVLHNERLEFLGDAVLDLIIGEYLFREYPQMAEGELTKIKAAVVCEQSLAPCSEDLQFGKYLRMGRGEVLSGGRHRPSILADTFESVVGTIYIDASYKAAQQFVLSHLKEHIKEALAGQIGKDYKTLLQEVVQAGGEADIHYRLIAESGPDHDKRFTMEVQVDGKSYESGTGHSKKEAEQRAAQLTLQKWYKS